MRHNTHIGIVFVSVFVSILLCTSCKKGNLDMLGMFWTLSEDSDERFQMGAEYDKQNAISHDTIYTAEEDYLLYVMTDIHVDHTTYNLRTFTHAYLNDPKAASFCLCLGDQINAVDNYPQFMAYVDTIRMAGREVYSCPGNHDIYYDQWKDYFGYWHNATYWFVVITPSGQKDLYISLDSSNGTLGTDQMKWLEEVLAEKATETYRHRIVYTHTHFWKKDQSQGHTSNFALEETYHLANLFSKYGVEIVLQGHSHHRNLTTFQGVDYLRLDAMEDHYYNAFYTLFTIGKQIHYDFIPVGPQDPNVEETRIPDIPF